MKINPEVERRRLRAHLQRILPHGVEAIADAPDTLERLAPALGRRAPSTRQGDRARAAIVGLARDEEVAPDGMMAIEAIILPELRPVVDIAHDSFEAPEGLWAHLGEGEVRRRLLDAIPSVARIELRDVPGVPYVGTAFVVGPDLVMTNRHVAELFTSGLGRDALVFKPGLSARVDFREEIVDSPSIELDVIEPVMIHPHWDMAILRVAPLAPAQRVMRLSVEHPDDLIGHEIGVIGYPAFDPRNDATIQNHVFRGVYNVKRLQPGSLTGRRTVRSFRRLVNALAHDASTLGGNSGSAVIDLTTGRVVALHFAGIYKRSNFAAPTHELARDPRVRALGLGFEGTPPEGAPGWLDAWAPLET